MPTSPRPPANPDRFDLADILSPDQFLALTEAFGGTRLYIPVKAKAAHPLVAVLGEDEAQKLIATIGYGYVCVPLARSFRAQHYRAQGKSMAQIARLLGMSEKGVSRIFNRRSR